MKKLVTLIALAGAAMAALFAAPAFAVPPDGLPLIAFGGMLVNRDTISSLFTGLKTLFHGTLKAQTGDWKKTAMEVPSTAAGEDYAWLSRFPKLRKWVGDKVVKNLAAGKYYKANEDWETTISVKRNDIEDDRLGLYNNQAMQAGEAAAELHDIIVDDLKNNAFAGTCMDGQYFYDTDHPVAGASVSNKGTAALAAASYGAARVAMMSLKDEEGMPLRLIPDVLEVPPALEATAKAIVGTEKLADNTNNPYYGTAEIVVNPGLTSATAWFLHVTKKASVKPFIVQMRKAPVFVSQTSSENDDVFMRAEYKFGAEARATGLYGYWQLSYGSTGTA